MPNPSQTALPPTGSDIFGEHGAAVTVAAAVIMMLAISAIDKLSGYDLHLGVLQLIPVAFATWAAGRNWGIALALASSAIWLVMFRGSPHFAWHPFFYWDVAVLLGMLIVFVLLIDRLHKELHRSDARFVKVLEGLDAPVYVADPQRGEILYGNQHFRDRLAVQPYDALAAYPGKSCNLRWPDGRRVVLRILDA